LETGGRASKAREGAGDGKSKSGIFRRLTSFFKSRVPGIRERTSEEREEEPSGIKRRTIKHFF